MWNRKTYAATACVGITLYLAYWWIPMRKDRPVEVSKFGHVSQLSNAPSRVIEEKILLQNCDMARTLQESDLIKIKQPGRYSKYLTFAKYKQKRAKEFLMENGQPPKENLKFSPDGKTASDELAVNLIHDYTEKMDLPRIENDLRREKERRLALGDTDILQLPEIVRELKQSKYKVPNIVHFVYFGCENVQVHAYMAFLGVFRYHNPAIILYHSDCKPYGPYWDAFKAIAGEKVRVVKRSPPTEVWGSNLEVIQHKSDVARLQILFEVGGIYLDMDSLVLRSLDKLRDFNITLGEESDTTVENNVIIVQKDSWFLKRWYWEYHYYRRNEWGHNSYIMAWSLWKMFPSTVNVVPFKMARPNWNELKYLANQIIDWSDHYTVHLYIRSLKAYDVNRDRSLKELAVLRTTYGELARYIIWGDKAVRDVTDWLVTCNITEMLIRDWKRQQLSQ